MMFADIGKDLLRAFDDGYRQGIKDFVSLLESSAILCEITNGNGKQVFEEVVTFIEIENLMYSMTEGSNEK